MTTHIPNSRHLRHLPDGDPGRITPVTRIIWADEQDMPAGRNSMACIAEDGTTVIVIRESLAASAQRAEIRKLRTELRQLGASRLAATAIIAADGVRRLGWRFIAQQAGQHTVAVGTMAATAVAGSAVALSVAHGSGGIPYGSPAWHREHPVHVTLPQRPLSYLGAYEPSSPRSYTGMETFADTCGRQANVALYYSGWYEPFQGSFAMAAAAHGAIPLVQINPEIGSNGQGISLAGIANGTYDSYLVNFADEVASYGHAVIIGFGHEMNGGWYPWGYGHQDPAEFVAAWQHIVNVFRRQGADNVTWLWTANVIGPKTGPLDAYWPGSNYVTWVGIDGYYRHPDDTWSNVFAPTIATIRQQIPSSASTPVLIAETAIGPVRTEPWQLQDMYGAIRHYGFLGFVWFDATTPYRLEGDAAVIAAFRQDTMAWRLQHQRAAAPSS